MSSVIAASAPERVEWNPVRLAVTSLLIAGIIASYLSLSAPSFAQETAGVADFVPDTALFYGEVELDQESSQFVMLHDLLERANLEALLSEEDLHEVESGLDSVDEVFSGSAGFFVTEIPSTEDLPIESITGDAADISGMGAEDMMESGLPQGWAAVLHPEDAEALFAEYSDELIGTGSTIETEYEGYVIYSQEAEDEYSDPMAIALVDDVIVIATVPEDIQPVIDTVTGASDPLSGDENFQDIQSRLPAENLVFGYVNGPAFLDSIVAQEPELLDVMTDDIVVSLGAYQGVALWTEEVGIRSESIAVAAEGTEFPDANVFVPAFTDRIADDSLIYAGGVDLGQTPGLDALALLFAEELVGIDPMSEATPVDAEAYADEIFAEAEGVLGFNIKTDLLDQLVGEWGMTATVNDITGIEPDVSAVFAVEVEDQTAVSKVTSTITNILAAQEGEGFTISSRVVEGADVTVVDLSESGTPLVLDFGVVDKTLLIGVNKGIDSFLTTPASTLADNETFQATLDTLPDDVTSIVYVNTQELLPLVEDVIALTASSSMLDNDPSCAEFATQEEAQAAYEEDDLENYMLDLDWDGEACEDFFTSATPAAEPVGVSDINVLSIGTVTYNDGEVVGTSSVIMIGE